MKNKILLRFPTTTTYIIIPPMEVEDSYGGHHTASHCHHDAGEVNT